MSVPIATSVAQVFPSTPLVDSQPTRDSKLGVIFFAQTYVRSLVREQVGRLTYKLSEFPAYTSAPVERADEPLFFIAAAAYSHRLNRLDRFFDRLYIAVKRDLILQRASDVPASHATDRPGNRHHPSVLCVCAHESELQAEELEADIHRTIGLLFNYAGSRDARQRRFAMFQFQVALYGDAARMRHTMIWDRSVNRLFAKGRLVKDSFKAWEEAVYPTLVQGYFTKKGELVPKMGGVSKIGEEWESASNTLRNTINRNRRAQELYEAQRPERHIPAASASCLYCGKPFAARKGTKFHSNNCRKRYHEQQKGNLTHQRS